jgi:phenylacetate-coenzyme A ligase PaaK-like adenylate-forming protein
MLRCKYRFLAMWGVDILDRMAYLWGRSACFQPGLPGLWARLRTPVHDWLRNRLRLPAYHLGTQELQRYLRRLAAFGPVSLYAYTSAGFLLAQEAEARGVRLDSLRAIILSAEPVYPEVARTVERAFGVPALIEYGSVESGMMAAQWPDRTLRVREDCLLLETSPRGDGRFDILLTVLNNPSFPLVRYAIGDSTDAPLHIPPSGFAILGSLVGRRNDLIVTRAGRVLHPILFDEIFSRHAAVRGWHIRQHADGGLSIQVELKTPDTALDRAALARRVQDLVDGYPVQLDVFKELSRTAAGKHRWIQSDLADLGRPSSTGGQSKPEVGG